MIFIKDLHALICRHIDTYTFSFSIGEGQFHGDVLKLFYETFKNKIYSITTKKVIEMVFGSTVNNNFKNYEETKLWNNESLQNIEQYKKNSKHKKYQNYKEHWERIEESNLDYPILVYKINKYYWNIADGFHRLAKSYLSGKK